MYHALRYGVLNMHKRTKFSLSPHPISPEQGFLHTFFNSVKSSGKNRLKHFGCQSLIFSCNGDSMVAPSGPAMSDQNDGMDTLDCRFPVNKQPKTPHISPESSLG